MEAEERSQQLRAENISLTEQVALLGGRLKQNEYEKMEKLTALNEDVAKLTRQLSEETANADKLAREKANEVQRLTTELDTLKSLKSEDSNRVAEQLASLSTQVASMTESSQAALAEKAVEVQNLQHSIAQVQRADAEKAEKINALTEQSTLLSAQLSALQLSFDLAAKEKDAALTSAKDEASLLQKNIVEKESQIAKLQGDLNSFKSSSDSTHSEHEGKIKLLETELDVLKSGDMEKTTFIGSLSDEIAKSTAEITAMKLALEAESNEKKKLSEKLEAEVAMKLAFEAESKEKQKLVEKLEAEVAMKMALEADSNEKEKLVEKLEADIALLKKMDEDKVTKFDEERVTLKKATDEKEQKIQELLKENEVLGNQLVESTGSAEASTLEMEAQVEALKAQVADLKSSDSSKSEMIAKFTEQIASLSTLMTDLKQKYTLALSEKADELMNLETEMEILKNEKASTQAGLEKDLQEKGDEIQNLTDRLNLIHSNLSAVEQNKYASEESLLKLKEENEKLQQAIKEQAAALNEDKQKLLNQIRDMNESWRAESMALSAEKTTIAEHGANTAKELAALQELHAALSSEKEKLVEQSANSAAQILKLSSAMAATEGSSAEKIKELLDQIAQLEASSSALQKEMAQLQTALGQERVANESTSAALAIEKASNEAKSTEIAAQSAAAATSLEAAQAELVKISSEKQQLQAKVDSLTQQQEAGAADSSAKVAALQSAKEALEKDMDALKIANEEANQNIKTTAETVEELKMKNTSLEVLLRNTREEGKTAARWRDELSQDILIKVFITPYFYFSSPDVPSNRIMLWTPRRGRSPN